MYRSQGEVTAAEVVRLARSLGLAGAPRSQGAAWTVGTMKDGSGPLLSVTKQAPGAWSYTRFGPVPGGDNCIKITVCRGSVTGEGPDGDISSPREDTGVRAADGDSPAVSEAVAKQAAAPVLKALDQPDAALDAGQLIGSVRVVNADPVIGGLPTHGWPSLIKVGSDGRVSGGSGRLKAPAPGGSYPVIGASEALTRLNRGVLGSDRTGECGTPVPLTGTARPTGPGGAGATRDVSPRCGPADVPPTVVIDRAMFGLAPRAAEGGVELVPSWLFRTAPQAGPPYTVTEPALAEELPRSGPPPVGPAERVVSFRADGQVLTLTFWGGVCGAHAGQAHESGDAVLVRVTTQAAPPGRVCPMIIKKQTVTVTLLQPLGDRPVLDRTTGERIPEG